MRKDLPRPRRKERKRLRSLRTKTKHLRNAAAKK